MGPNRVFVPQETLDAWLTQERVDVDGDVMTLRAERRRFRLQTAVLFVSEVTGAEDAPALVGKVKDLDQLAALGGEHCADSVVLGDNAYEVVQGFAGEPLFDERAGGERPSDVARGADLATAARAATGEADGPDEIDRLARFFSSAR